MPLSVTVIDEVLIATPPSIVLILLPLNLGEELKGLVPAKDWFFIFFAFPGLKLFFKYCTDVLFSAVWFAYHLSKSEGSIREVSENS